MGAFNFDSMANTITIRKEKYKVKTHSYRAMFLFEEVAGKSVSQATTLKDNILYLHCLLVSCNEDFPYDFDELLDVMEEETELLAELQGASSEKKR